MLLGEKTVAISLTYFRYAPPFMPLTYQFKSRESGSEGEEL